MAVQTLFGSPATLMTGPNDTYAAIVSLSDRALVLRSEAGRRITQYPLHQGSPSAQAVIAQLSRQGFMVQADPETHRFAEQAGFVPSHLGALAH